MSAYSAIAEFHEWVVASGAVEKFSLILKERPKPKKPRPTPWFPPIPEPKP